MITEWHLLDTGYCEASAQVAYGVGSGTVNCHATCALLRHTTRGWLLFDTGYAPRVLDATQDFPYSLYAKMTPMHVSADRAVAAQLPRFGITASDIRFVVVSHFHADHIGGLRDFGNAHLYCSRAAFVDIDGRTGFDAVRRAFLPQLLPPYFGARATLTHKGEERNRYRYLLKPDWKRLKGAGTPTLQAARQGRGANRYLLDEWHGDDLFGDGSVMLVPLPGHAAGQLGMLVRTERNKSLFFVADAAYSARAIRENLPFHPITRLFTHDFRAARETLAALHGFHLAFPEVELLPTHCPEVYKRCAE